ncbi:UNVERIFIED_CONTAM: hypothetical protein GTU68_026742 [Idotea baltica]|nr:hypothetical protein [Idotea baltica]
MFDNWFLDYASYVILERAVPYIEDGLKPVQRRLLHALKQMDDGRFHKVANVIGQTMQYHPHGDASIEDALVKLGQKDLMIDCQGNWGDNRTGDRAAAARYIEARLTKFALEVAFKKEITDWQLSYDGRKNEPVALPMKFPLLLFQGVEGIAVGLATKIMPHNFIELLECSIKHLQGEEFELLPDFPSGGIADFSNYNDGLKGGKIKVRCNIEELDKKTLVLRDIPYGTTTGNLIDSIVKANDKGKIKVKKIIDNTAEKIEILVELATGISPRQTIDALYAFTDCESSISPNACVIIQEKPRFIGVSEMLKISTKNTKRLLKLELEYKLSQLEDKWHMSSLEKIFIENRIYRDIEECETWEAVIETIDKGLEPFKHLLFREVTRDDIVRLTEIKIKRISKFDAFKADEAIKQLDLDMKEIKRNLKNLTKFAVNYFQNLIDKYGKGRERKTKISGHFSTIQAAQVAVNNTKLYANLKDGFIGYGLKKDEFICECSDIDDIIVFKKDGTMSVHRIDDKTYVGKNIIHVAVWKKNDVRMVYNLAYTDPAVGKSFIKRFNVKSITRDKQYDITKGATKGKLLYFSANPNGEAETISVQLTPGCSARNKEFIFDFSTISIKGRDSKGNVLTKWPIRKVAKKSDGTSTLSARKIWVDKVSGELNNQERGQFLGEFNTGDLVFVVYSDGCYELTNYEFTNRFKMEEVYLIEKFNPQTVLSCVYFHGEKKAFFVKRFNIETNSLNTKYYFVPEDRSTKLGMFSTRKNPIVQYSYIKGRKKEELTDSIEIESFIEVKGWKSLGNKLSIYPVNQIRVVPEGELL